jgi:hypothetical protein
MNQLKRTPIPRKTRMKAGKGFAVRKGINKVGKQGRANKRANATLAKRYIESGLPQRCEARFLHACTGEAQLTWAHNAKRRKKPDLLHAALICQNAHNAIEYLPPEQMGAIVDQIIAARETL